MTYVKKTKPKGLLMKQRGEFLKFCPICGKVPIYIHDTNIIVCDHADTEFTDRHQYVKLLNARGEIIARALFEEV